MAELPATKKYMVGILKKGKTRSKKSPYDAPLSFVKQNGKLRISIYYHALNRKPKHNNAPIPRADEMLDSLGQPKYSLKLCLKVAFIKYGGRRRQKNGFQK